jgi:hypothetical protein
MFICIKLLPWYYCDVEETELPSEKMQRPGCRNIYTQNVNPPKARRTDELKPRLLSMTLQMKLSPS